MPSRRPPPRRLQSESDSRTSDSPRPPALHGRSYTTGPDTDDLYASRPDQRNAPIVPVPPVPLRRVENTGQGDVGTANGSGSESVYGPRTVRSTSPTGSDYTARTLRALSPSSSRAGTPHMTRPPRPFVNANVDAESSSSSVASSSSMSRSTGWNTVRSKLVPSVASSMSPVLSTPPVMSQSSSFASFSQHQFPVSRPQTPKPSRFRFRQAAEQLLQSGRSGSVDDDSGKFAEEIRKACAAARFGDTKGARMEAVGPLQGTAGVNTSLPFMSSTSLAATASSSTTTLLQPMQNRYGLRRPQSMQSLALASRHLLSVKNLRQVLLYYSPASNAGAVKPLSLPFESDILSTLLIPFLVNDFGERNGEERQAAVEAFETAVKTWPGGTDEAELERCLWCCKAASTATSLRPRLLGILSSLLAFPGRAFSTTPIILKTLMMALFTLLPSCTFTAGSSSDLDMIKELINQVQMGLSGELDLQAIEKEYSVPSSKGDNVVEARQIIVVEALMQCLEFGAEDSRRWLLCNVIEDFWPVYRATRSTTPLRTRIHCRKIATFLRAASAFLRSAEDTTEMVSDAEVILKLLQTRVLPELEVLDDTEDLEQSCVHVVLGLLCSERTKGSAVNFTSSWYQSALGWKANLEKELKHTIETWPWPKLLKLLHAVLKELPDNVCKGLATIVFPTLNERLVNDPPSHPCPPLTQLLETAARQCPQIFYKPLFTCAASSKELNIVNQLCYLTAISRFFPEFWTRDAEMMAIALLNDAGGAKAKITKSDSTTWGPPRLGQSIVLVELIDRIRTLRQTKGDHISADQSYTTIAKFLGALELRLTVLLDAKEQTTFVPLSQRKLFCVLFLEIRLFTRSLKSAPWLGRIISWTLLSHSGAHSSEANIGVDDEVLAESFVTLDQLHALYKAALDGSQPSHKHRSTVLFSPTLKTSFLEEGVDGLPSIFARKVKLVTSLSSSLTEHALDLLVAMSALLTREDYLRVGPYIWARCLDEHETSKSVVSASFLIMQYAEKSPEEFSMVIEKDLARPSTDMRRQAVARLTTLTSCRFQILSQLFISDRNHRRPFKLTRPAIAFVATDIGSGQFVLEEDPNDTKDFNGTIIPSDLRKRLFEIGWAQDEKPVDEQMKWARTPMSLLPSLQAERLDMRTDPSPSPSPSPSLSPTPTSSPAKPNGSELLRRKSSAGGHFHGVKRRPVIVSPVLSFLPRLASLASDADQDVSVTSAARETVMDLMRDDPALLCRSIFDSLSDASLDMSDAVTIFRAFLHLRRTLPPSLSHHIFNHLAGFLKFLSKSEDPEALRDFAYVTPILAKLVSQVSDMSVRQLRRAKVEVFVLPSGPLWFPPSAPSGPMFPRMLGNIQNPFEELPPRLVWVTMIRVSQNMFFLSMLKRNPQEVHVIRTNMTKLTLPSRVTVTDTQPLDLIHMSPRKPSLKHELPLHHDRGLEQLSLTLSRSYLLLVAQVFRAMSRHLNDRDELAGLVHGVNRILLSHSDDIGIVSHALIALMIVSTRFRRLVTSGGGYTLFMPAVVKVYAEAEKHSGIRAAIEYAVDRFYALHEDVFVFQTLDIVSHWFMKPDVDGDWIAKHVFALLATLNSKIGPSGPDAAGIHGANQSQEREALIAITAEERPQALLTSLRRRGGSTNDMRPDIPDMERERKRLQFDNFVKLFLTVIAHDPGTVRAEQFLRLFRFLVPHINSATSSVRGILREGIDALGVIFMTKLTGKPKVGETLPSLNSVNSASMESLAREAGVNGATGGSTSPSDAGIMRHDYLLLTVAFLQSGGDLSFAHSQRTLELVKVMLKDAPHSSRESLSQFMANFTRYSIIRDPPLQQKQVVAFLREIAPILRSYATAVDFSLVYGIVSELCANPIYATDTAFTRLVVSQYCSSALEICELAASENLLFSLPARRSIINLVVHAVSLSGSDVIAELEKRTTSSSFLAGVVLPLTLRLKTMDEVAAESQGTYGWRRDAHAKAWLRLLHFVMTSCHKPTEREIRRSGSLHVSDRPKLEGQEHAASAPVPVATCAIATQIIKVIVTRAENDLSAFMPGVWSRIASFFRTLLADGDANFALYSQDFSPIMSYSPGSPTFPDFRSPISPGDGRIAPPRIVDHLMWSLLEFLCLRRNPLVVQLRLFMQEKVQFLHQQLLSRQHDTPRRTSRRLSSSVYAKPRVRASGNHSAGPSPEGTPFLKASSSYTDAVPPLSLTPPPPSTDGREAGFNRFPSPTSPSYKSSFSGPKIVHLGPAFVPSGLRRSISPSRGAEFPAKIMAKSSKIRSGGLARKTYRKVRLVQMCMGYELFLPFDEEGDFVEIQVWTKTQALNSIVEEAKELIEEFPESFGLADIDAPFP